MGTKEVRVEPNARHPLGAEAPIRHAFSMIFISHDLAVIRNICDRVAVMYLGKIVEIGDTEDVFRTPRHRYTSALLGSLLAPGQKLPAEK